MPLSRDDVRYAYVYVLGREPENEGAIAHYQNAFDKIWDLREHLFASPEYRGRASAQVAKSFVAHTGPEDVETHMDAATLAQVVGKTAAYWSRIGKSAPHWSVLTESKYLPEELDAYKAEFYESGIGDLALIRDLLGRAGRGLVDFSCAVELGCGVGRATVHLANAFPRLVAIDISASHLAVAKQEVEARGNRNVQFLQATAENVMPAEDYDLWYSRLVLQHNPPPVTLAILDRAFAKLPSRGMAIVHVRTWGAGYRFSVADYLRDGPSRDMEMHAAPQKAILRLAQDRGCRIVEVHEEPGHTDNLTNIFVFEKE